VNWSPHTLREKDVI